MFAPVFLVAFPIALIATIVCALTLPGTGNVSADDGRRGPSDHQRGGGRGEELHRHGRAAARGELNGADRCNRSGPSVRSVRSVPGSFATTIVEGEVFYELEQFRRWPAGMSIVCTGPHLGKVLVVERTRGERLLVTGICLGLSLGTGLMALSGMRLRRSLRAINAPHRRPPS